VDDPAWYTFRKETLEELESSGRLVEDFLRSQRSRIRVQRRDLAEAWRTVIESHPNSFGHLRRELKSWLGFLTNENAPSNAIAALQARKNFSAPLAFDEWQGYQTRRDVGTLTTMISRLKPRSR